jgi:hypothetical protein
MKEEERFKTHIKEPRSQQVASIILVLIVIAGEIYWLFFR